MQYFIVVVFFLFLWKKSCVVHKIQSWGTCQQIASLIDFFLELQLLSDEASDVVYPVEWWRNLKPSTKKKEKQHTLSVLFFPFQSHVLILLIFPKRPLYYVSPSVAPCRLTFYRFWYCCSVWHWQKAEVGVPSWDGTLQRCHNWFNYDRAGRNVAVSSCKQSRHSYFKRCEPQTWEGSSYYIRLPQVLQMIRNLDNWPSCI